MAINTVDLLNDLLRGELAATETYQQALAEVEGESWEAPLKQIHADHRAAANSLRQQVHQEGGKPDQDSGTWGMFAKFIEGAAKFFGDTAAVKALKKGEESGLHSYEEALENPDLPANARQVISSTLLPQTRNHITMLDSLLTAR